MPRLVSALLAQVLVAILVVPAAFADHKYRPHSSLQIGFGGHHSGTSIHLGAHHGYRYGGHGHRGHHHGDDALGYLFLGLLTVGVIHALTHSPGRTDHNSQYPITSAPSGETVYWNQSTANALAGGAPASVAPVNAAPVNAAPVSNGVASGQCRSFRQVVFIDGQQQTVNGTMCRDGSGGWQVVDTDR